MQHNVVKDKVLGGEPSLGAAMELPSPELMEICGYLGFEWSMINAEHGPITPGQCQDLCRACEARGMVPMVRVPENNPVVIMNYLQTGPLGLGVPHIKTVEDAEAVVRAARYYPEGQRGCDLSQRSSGYSILESPGQYYARSNRELLIVIWIEDVEGFENLDAILQVPGIDAVNFGAGDLALSMEMPGAGEHGLASHPDVKAVLDEGRRKVLAAGKAFMSEPADLVAAKQAIADGATLINTRITTMLANTAAAYLRELRGQ